jgi:hypothetical protein
LYTIAHKAGDAVASNNLGEMYMDGTFVKRDLAIAFELFQLACRAGCLELLSCSITGGNDGWGLEDARSGGQCSI